MNFFIFITTVTAASILAASASGLLEIDESISVPSVAFSWLDDKDTFEAGDIATIKIKVLSGLDNNTNFLNGHRLNLTLMVNGKKGNNTYVSGVTLGVEGDSANWNISFVPILVGLFNVVLNDEHLGILDSSLHFKVIPGHMYPSACVVSWRGLVNEFVAGERATVLILPKDAFGNNILSTSEEPNSYKFMVSSFYENGSIGGLLNVSYMGWNGFGYVGIEFIVVTAGNLLLNVDGGNQSLNGSPLPFKVKPGPLDISKCSAKWNYGTNALQIFSKLEIFIHQQDQFGNLVPGLNAFDAEVVEKETNLSIPIADLYFKEVAPGIQLISFSVIEPGDLVFTIFDSSKNQSISNMPYNFTVFVGYCDGLNSVANGSGLVNSVAGEISKFSVYLEDKDHDPSPVEAERVRVQIMRKLDSYIVLPSIYPIQPVDGPVPSKEFIKGASSLLGSAPTPSEDPNNTASSFEVIFTPEKSGTYEMQVSCGNIPLNGGHPYIVEVMPGAVDIKLSGVIKFVAKVPKLVKNEIVVQLVDSFSNPVILQQTKLGLEFCSANASAFLIWKFVDNNDGSYSVYYLAKDIGAYDICVSFEGKHLSPCPFWIYVYNSDYFPKAFNDTISVWEDESVSFDGLGNDYFAGGSASIVEMIMPQHGSLLQYGWFFRYTPYKGFFGNDTFSYTISDVNNNSAIGTVFVSVLITAPQLISLPARLQAIEDVISPLFGGFLGIAIEYSDPMENISVTLSAQSGAIFLSPMLMQFWQPAWTGLAMERGNREGKSLILVGCVEVITFVLQSVQYLGNENFSGDDIIKVSMRNKNGIHDGYIPVFVEPINDPPFIHIPEFIILEKGNKDSSQIFSMERDKLEFSIGDPDLLSFPGDKSRFTIALSMEVDNGILITNLPADLLNTTELMLKNSHQWQPLQTFVTISKHFLVKGRGIRFRGTFKDCNEAMQHLLYQGGEYGAVLTVTINDMGNYGCYPDCEEMMSLPLFAESTINLTRRRPMSSLIAQTLGSVIVVEFIVMLFLGGLLLFFICKCALHLRNERGRYVKDRRLLKEGKCQKPTSSGTSSGNVTYFTGCFSNPLLLGGQHSNVRQRSFHRSGNGDTNKDECYASQSSSDNCQLTRPITNFMPLAIQDQKEVAGGGP